MRAGIIQLLKENKLKITSERKEIMKVLEDVETPLSPADIFNRVKSALPRTNLSTVYRNLELLEQKDLVKRFGFKKNRFYYELIPDRPHHHHVICKRCGMVEDSKILAEGFIEKVADSSSFKIEDHNFDFFGLCRPCQTE